MLESSSCPGGGIGRHARLKILWPQGRAGSIPALGTRVDGESVSKIIWPLRREGSITAPITK